VTEVALGVYFSPPLNLRTAQFGKLWDRWRDRYPRTEDQPPLPPIPLESFTQPFPVLSFQFTGTLPGPRVWYLSDAGDRVIQIQPDRLVLNWRHTTEEEPYPRYKALFPAFSEAARDLIAFLSEEGLALPTIVQAEVTYVNPIPIDALGDSGDLSHLITLWSGALSDEFLPTPEDVRLSIRYRIPDPSSGDPIGRLYVEGTPAFHQGVESVKASEVFMLQIFARGKPLGDGLEGALAFLDVGHDWVVRGFTSLTTERMHEEWGREE
jgi:uncharacterized protein (TIGR04255 family)